MGKVICFSCRRNHTQNSLAHKSVVVLNRAFHRLELVAYRAGFISGSIWHFIVRKLGFQVK